MVHCAHDGGKLLPCIHCVYASLDATPPPMRPTRPAVSPGRPLQGRRKRPTATATATTLQLPLQRVRSGKEKPEHAKPTNGLSACPACSGGTLPPTLPAVGELRSAAQTHRRQACARGLTLRYRSGHSPRQFGLRFAPPSRCTARGIDPRPCRGQTRTRAATNGPHTTTATGTGPDAAVRSAQGPEVNQPHLPRSTARRPHVERARRRPLGSRGGS